MRFPTKITTVKGVYPRNLKRDGRGADSGVLHLDEAVGAELRCPVGALRSHLRDGAEVGEEPAPRLGQVDELLERGGFVAPVSAPDESSITALIDSGVLAAKNAKVAKKELVDCCHGLTP